VIGKIRRPYETPMAENLHMNGSQGLHSITMSARTSHSAMRRSETMVSFKPLSRELLFNLIH
jgi:hypothetical protein